MIASTPVGRWLFLAFLIVLAIALPFIIAADRRHYDACIAETARELPQLSENARVSLCLD